MSGIYITKDFLDRIIKYLWFIVFICHTAFRNAIPGGQRNTVYMIVIATVLLLVQEYYSNGTLNLKDRMPYVSVAFLVFVMYVFIMRPYGPYSNPDGAILSVYRRLSLPLIFCIELYAINRKRINDLLKTFSIAMTFFSIVITVTTPVSLWGDARLYGTFTGIQRNLASLLFIFGISAALYIISELKEKKYYICVVILFIANLITGSRKGIIQVFLVFGLFFLLNGTIKDKLKYIPMILVVIIIGIVAFMKIPWLQEMFGQRMLAIVDDSIGDSSKEHRDLYRALAFIAFLDRPVIGNGLDSFCIINEQITGIKAYSHCNFTELLCDYGIIGFILYYFNYVLWCFKAFVNKSNSLAKLVIYSVLPLIVIEYGQVTYYQPMLLTILVLLFSCAKVAMGEAKSARMS